MAVEQTLVKQCFYLKDEAATVALGQALGKRIENGGVIFLDGTLGAGKTTLCRGVLNAFGYSGPVKSPTYTLVEPYELDTSGTREKATRKVYHFDLYRLGDPEELEYMGIRDYFSEASLCLIEWFEKGVGVLPRADILVEIVPDGEGRLATLHAHTPHGQQWVESLSGK